VEDLLFHGTKLRCALHQNGSFCVDENCSVCSIVQNGFNSSRGIWFATAPTTSCQYAEKHGYQPVYALLVCNVLLGQVAQSTVSITNSHCAIPRYILLYKNAV
jgi:hypothetical protein